MPDVTVLSAAPEPKYALSVVIPVYNGAASIEELVAALENLQVTGGHEIVLVNDCSPDDSLSVCRFLVENARIPITLIELSRNYGEHNAVMAGLHQARGAHVITMDDDLQNPPEEVERLLAFAQESGCEVTVKRLACPRIPPRCVLPVRLTFTRFVELTAGRP